MAMSLVAKLKKERSKSHAYLLAGSNQDEIKSAIEYIVQSAGGLSEDIVKIIDEKTDKSSEIKVEAVRNFLHGLYLSAYGPVRIGIIEGCERLNTSSANILLKILEEPPENVILILTAANENILMTVKSRCRVYKTDSQQENEDHTFSYENIMTDNLAGAFKTVENIVKSGETDTFLAGILAKAEQKMVKNLDPEMEKLAGSIISARRKIKSNVNPRLVLENLIIRARKSKLVSD